MTNPEISLIQKLSEVRQALEAERQALLARVATIDQALALASTTKTTKTTKATKPNTKQPKVQRAGGIREAVLTSLLGKTGTTIRQLQEMLPDHSPKSVESVTHGLASAGLLKKEGTNPKRFSLAAVAAE